MGPKMPPHGDQGDLLGASWVSLGASWGFLWPLGGSLGASWGSLVGLWGHLGDILEDFEVQLISS